VRTFFSRLLDRALRRRREERLSEEIQAHLDMLTDEYVAKGLSAADARLAARKDFGGVEQTKMRYRDQRGLPVVDALWQDVRFAFRVLARDRGFALTAIVVLAVGIGVNNMFFTLVYAHKFRGLAIERPERVLSISTIDGRGSDTWLSLPEYDELQRAQGSFDAIGAWLGGVVAVGDEGRAPDRFDAAYVSWQAWPVLGIAPIMGRGPLANEDRPGAPPVVMLGVNAWRSRYAGDPEILGRTILIDGLATTVVGIMPERSGFPSTAGVWLPLGQAPGLSPKRDARSLRVFGRLRKNTTIAAASAEIEGLFARLETAYPDTNAKVRARVVPINSRLLGGMDGWGAFIMAGIIVILVACANVANLMVARALHRAPEIAIRSSLGASRGRIVTQLLVEAVVLAAIGGSLGGLISIGGVRLFQSAIPAGTLPYWMDYSMDARIFAALVVMSLITVVVFGLVPAFQASRTDINRTLKNGSRSATGQNSARLWTGAFLTAELTLAMILLTKVALPAAVAREEVATDARIDSSAVMTTAITLQGAAYPTPERREDFFRRLSSELTRIPGVTSVSRTTLLPASGGGSGIRPIAIDGLTELQSASLPRVQVIDIAPSYFATLDIPLARGRDFGPDDGTGAVQTAIVNDQFAETYLEGRDPIGTRIAIVASNEAVARPTWLTVVGMAPEIRQQGPGGRAQHTPIVYVPIAVASPATSILMVRHAIEPEAIAGPLRTEVHAIDPNVPLYRMQTLAGAVRDALWNIRVSAYLANTVCLLSLLLAMVGLSAVTAQRVTMKTREIGLRMALGARPGQVMRLSLGGLRVPVILGLLLGTIGAVAWDRAFSPESVDVYASTPPTLLKIAGFIVVLVVVSCFMPLRRAAAINPITALRHD